MIKLNPAAPLLQVEVSQQSCCTDRPRILSLCFGMWACGGVYVQAMTGSCHPQQACIHGPNAQYSSSLIHTSRWENTHTHTQLCSTRLLFSSRADTAHLREANSCTRASAYYSSYHKNHQQEIFLWFSGPAFDALWCSLSSLIQHWDLALYFFFTTKSHLVTKWLIERSQEDFRMKTHHCFVRCSNDLYRVYTTYLGF